jgi:hypothetical protein
MSALLEFAIKGLREAREELLSLPKQNLSYSQLMAWFNKY